MSIKLAKWFLRRFILIGQSQRRTANDGYVGTKYRIAVQDLSNIIPTKQQFIVSEESIYFFKSANQKQELHMSTMFLSNRDEMSWLWVSDDSKRSVDPLQMVKSAYFVPDYCKRRLACNNCLSLRNS
jgi:hypothetical protein